MYKSLFASVIIAISMGITYPSGPRNDRVSPGRLLLQLRPHTLVADLVTGVEERREYPWYDSSIIEKWLRGKDSQALTFKVATRYWGSRPSQPGAQTTYADHYDMKGTADEIVSGIENMRDWDGGWPANNSNCQMQYLKYKDGRTKLTVTGRPEPDPY